MLSPSVAANAVVDEEAGDSNNVNGSGAQATASAAGNNAGGNSEENNSLKPWFTALLGAITRETEAAQQSADLKNDKNGENSKRKSSKKKNKKSTAEGIYCS